MRIKGLDFLRGIAILGVLFRHSEMSNVLVDAGGFGVDLFFVLSGFLVAGLLFKEYKKKGSTSIGRFLIRRGFKIYPAFYVFLILTILADTFYFKHPVPLSGILSEAFFLQSYGTPLRFHTWSLAAEEHFYFFIAFLVFLSVKFHWLDKTKAVITSLVGLILLELTMRSLVCFQHIENPIPIFASHLRTDGLFTGTLLAYLWNFKEELITKWQKNRRLLYFIAAVLIAPVFLISPGSFFIQTIGYNLLYVGFAVLIMLFANEDREPFVLRYPGLKQISLGICFIGVNSYSIYLCHLLVKDFVSAQIQSSATNTVVFFMAAIVVGILSAQLIEKPFMKLADRYFPRMS